MFYRRMPKQVIAVGSRYTAPKFFPFSFICILTLVIWLSLSWAGEPIYHSELIFPLEKWHNHASSIAELPNGDLLVAWYRGSGEHESNDVRIMGSRKAYSSKAWNEPFVMADTPNFPDGNPVIFIDRQKQLHLIWSMIVANDWRASFLKNRVSVDYQRRKQAPVWKIGEPLFFDLKDISSRIHKGIKEDLHENSTQVNAERIALLKKSSADKFLSHMGWIARSRPVVLPMGRILLPLYSDALSLSMIAISDDGGKRWFASNPIVGLGNIQPTVVRKHDGSLVAFMRNTGLAPKRLQMSVSKDDGITWSVATHINLPNPNSAADIIRLGNGYWALVYNDTEEGRHSLAVSVSIDEGKSWNWTRHLEQDLRGSGAGQFHYPSVVQTRDGLMHVSYSYFLNHLHQEAPNKAIKHAAFNLQWVQAGDRLVKK
jgi:predicted neuraminidase